MTTVLLVEDDPAISEPLARAFGREGYAVRVHGTGKGALEEVAGADIIVLDLGLPDMDGLDVARQVRSRGLTTPILMLTARSEATDLVVGLDAGADDYVTKPFRLAELLARVRALTRRRGGEIQDQMMLEVADLQLDRLKRKVTRSGRKINLQPREFRLLEYLMSNAGQVVTRTMLLEKVWEYHFDPQTNVIDVHISRLRSKIDKDFEPPLIHTERGAGYSLYDPSGYN